MDTNKIDMKTKEIKTRKREPCILIAEDDKEMRSLLYYFLTKFGYNIILCKDGRELIEKIGKDLIETDSEKSVDLIISDIRMPYASGLRIMKELKPSLNMPPVILITAFGSEEIHREAKKYGVAEIFDKPFDFDNLLLKVEELVPSYPIDKRQSNHENL